MIWFARLFLAFPEIILETRISNIFFNDHNCIKGCVPLQTEISDEVKIVFVLIVFLQNLYYIAVPHLI